MLYLYADRPGFRSGEVEPGTANRPITNHEANVVGYVQGRGFVAAHDSQKVLMVSQDGNLWGAVSTDRVLGEVQMATVNADTWGVDTTLPLYRTIVRAGFSSWPDFANTELGVLDLTDAINCWAAGPTEILLLERNGRITRIPRTDKPTNPAGTPNAPTIMTMESIHEGAVLTWTVPTSGPAVTGYTVQYTANGGASWSEAGTTGATTTVLYASGLTNGEIYYFRVAGTNGSGTGAWSEWSSGVRPAPVPPGPPGRVLLSAVDKSPTSGYFRRYQIDWEPPFDTGGAPIIGYAIQLTSQSTRIFATTSTAGTSYTTPVFDAGNWRISDYKAFRVAAITSAGRGAWSGESDLIRLVDGKVWEPRG